MSASLIRLSVEAVLWAILILCTVTISSFAATCGPATSPGAAENKFGAFQFGAMTLLRRQQFQESIS